VGADAALKGGKRRAGTFGQRLVPVSKRPVENSPTLQRREKALPDQVPAGRMNVRSLAWAQRTSAVPPGT